MKKALAWSYAVIMFIITLPVGLIIYIVAAESTFEGDEAPGYWNKFENLITWPLNKI